MICVETLSKHRIAFASRITTKIVPIINSTCAVFTDVIHIVKHKRNDLRCDPWNEKNAISISIVFSLDVLIRNEK